MKFVSPTYPQLRVKVPGGGYVDFVEQERDDPNAPRVGVLETDDRKAIEALKKLPDHYGVEAEATPKAPAKQGPAQSSEPT